MFFVSQIRWNYTINFVITSRALAVGLSFLINRRADLVFFPHKILGKRFCKKKQKKKRQTKKFLCDTQEVIFLIFHSSSPSRGKKEGQMGSIKRKAHKGGLISSKKLDFSKNILIDHFCMSEVVSR
jgi:hypothetical protein